MKETKILNNQGLGADSLFEDPDFPADRCQYFFVLFFWPEKLASATVLAVIWHLRLVPLQCLNIFSLNFCLCSDALFYTSRSTEDLSHFSWKRPHQLVRLLFNIQFEFLECNLRPYSCSQVEDPRIFVDGTSRRDVVQVKIGFSAHLWEKMIIFCRKVITGGSMPGFP